MDVPSVDVIVPVHGAGPVFRRCAASLIAHADAADAAFKLVIVLDGPPDAESLVAVEELRAAARREEGGPDANGRAAGGREEGRREDSGLESGREAGGFELEVLTHEKPLGFLRSVNRAWRESTRDAVLLNSDTQVTAGWLGRLRAAAYSDSKIATVTPFSNNATICSLPRFLDENAIPAGHTIDSFGALVTRVSRREYPRLPTGVGFCLYVKRSVLDEVGLFDEAFGLGYGEEVDLCFRAARRGYVHVLDDATFVFHEGSRSFGRRRESRMRRGERMMRERYPEYVTAISEFIKKDPIASARARVLEELRRPLNSGAAGRAGDAAGDAEASIGIGIGAIEGAPGVRNPRRVLHVVRGWPPWAEGKTEQYGRWLVRRQDAQREVFVYARMADPDRALGSAVEYVDGGARVRLIVNNFTQRNPLSRFGLRSREIGKDFETFLDGVRPDLVHIHHLAGHALNLLDIVHRRHLPVVYQVRDWWPLCARGDLIDRDGASCSGPGVSKCARCLPIARPPAAAPASVLFYAGRARAMRSSLANVDAFVMASQSIADRYTAGRVLPTSARVYVLPPDVASDAASSAVSSAPNEVSDDLSNPVSNGSNSASNLTAYASEIERIYEEVMNRRS